MVLAVSNDALDTAPLIAGSILNPTGAHTISGFVFMISSMRYINFFFFRIGQRLFPLGSGHISSSLVEERSTASCTCTQCISTLVQT